MATWIKKLTAESLEKVTLESLSKRITTLLLAYSFLVFVTYAVSIVILIHLEIYRKGISIVFNLVMFVLFYGTLGIHLNPGIEWFGPNSRPQEARSNLFMCRSLSLIGALLVAFLGSVYLYFDLVRNYWTVVFPSES